MTSSKGRSSPIHRKYLPSTYAIKIIDFGGATFQSEQHSCIINTRQYRAPEVILECCKWCEKSDIWCTGCILFELFTGDLIFPTHENREHILMIEKIVGPIPKWMAKESTKEMRYYFDLNKDESNAYKYGRMYYPSSHSLRRKIEKLPYIWETIKDYPFRGLIKRMLTIDPNNRPGAKELLNDVFFTSNYSTDTKGPSESTTG